MYMFKSIAIENVGTFS